MTPQKTRQKKPDWEHRWPAVRADESWTCPVCGASHFYLAASDPLFPERVHCIRCGFPSSLSVRPLEGGKGHMPMSALNDTWIKAWRIVYRQYNGDWRTAHSIMKVIKDPMIIIEAHEKLLHEKKEGEA